MLKRTFPLLIVVLLVSILVGCGGTGTITPIKLVPQKANMLAYMDLTRILEDSTDTDGLQDMFPADTETMLTFGNALEVLKGLDEGLLFGDISEDSGENGYTGFIVKGTFVENELVATIESLADEAFITVGYKDYKIYTDTSQETGIAFLSADTFVVSAMQTVKDVIDVKEGDQPAISGKVLDTYDGLGDTQVKLAMALSPGQVAKGLKDIDIPEQMQQAVDLAVFANIETIGMTLDEDAVLVSINLQMGFASNETADAAKSELDRLITLVVNFAPTGLLPVDIPQEVLELLSNLSVTTSDSYLNVGLETTTSELKNLSQGLFMLDAVPQEPVDIPLDVEQYS